MGKATVAFRSKPISARSQQLKTTQWKPPGSFRFFDLPPELRRHILEHLVQDPATAHRYVLALFLTCERLYSEAAALYYHEVVLDITHRMRPDPFLTGPSTRISPRSYVRTLSIHFYISERIHRFYTLYGPALRDMVEHGTLQRLELEIHSRFPAEDFWGGDSDTDLASEVLVKNKSKGKEILAPRFAIEHPFQSFLKFLQDANVPQLRLYVYAFDHHPFWCRFHRAHSSESCGGEWKGKTKMLKIKWKDVVTILGGARIMKNCTT
ncbi:hypothetical protein TruAng_004179 [Truncatella angustata]|nr:hypothetical protein TruAng_004179 [Truncatella angustata]